MARPNPIPFDTHRFVKRMTEAGMPAAQAEALADEQVALLNSDICKRSASMEARVGTCEGPRVGSAERNPTRADRCDGYRVMEIGPSFSA